MLNLMFLPPIPNITSSLIIPPISPAPFGPSIANSELSSTSRAQIRQHPQIEHPASPSPQPHSLKIYCEYRYFDLKKI